MLFGRAEFAKRLSRQTAAPGNEKQADDDGTYTDDTIADAAAAAVIVTEENAQTGISNAAAALAEAESATEAAGDAQTEADAASAAAVINATSIIDKTLSGLAKDAPSTGSGLFLSSDNLGYYDGAG